MWYEILRSSSYALTSLSKEDRPRWEKAFNELGSCLSIDTVAIRADDKSATTTGD
jgi:hypothetical protein